MKLQDIALNLKGSVADEHLALIIEAGELLDELRDCSALKFDTDATLHARIASVSNGVTL